jgi:signal transduction histidine kinase
LERDHASLQRLQEVDQVKQELVSTVSHELRTPITSISGYTELLAEGDLGELSEEQLDAIGRIERNASRLRVLVDDLLTLSREEADELEIAEEEVDLRAVVRETAELAQELVRGRRLEVLVSVPDSPVLVRGDGRALERVATNLVGNAVKFTPDGGRITLVAESSGSRGALVVGDTGMGISADEQEQLFTRFFRTTSATSQAIQGSGLGLSIVHAIVTRHGGAVSVWSEPGVGTTVRAELPLLVPPAQP